MEPESQTKMKEICVRKKVVKGGWTRCGNNLEKELGKAEPDLDLVKKHYEIMGSALKHVLSVFDELANELADYELALAYALDVRNEVALRD